MKNLIYALSGLTMLVSCSCTETQTKEKKNVLFIAADDLKPLLSCYGDTIAKTPNLDRLAAISTVFEHSYCQQAVSGATRSSLMTGLRPDHIHVYDLQTKIREMNPNVVSIAQHFKNEGYVTAGVGKIFHGGNVEKEDQEFSWSLPYLETDAYFDKKYGEPELKYYQNPEIKEKVNKYLKKAKSEGVEGKKKNFKKYLLKQGCHPATECIDIPDNAYLDGTIALCAQDQLKKLKAEGNPFFMAVGFHKPHLPFVAPKKYWDLYDRERLPLAEFQEHAAGSPDFAYHESIAIKKHSGMEEHMKYPAHDENRIGLSVEKQKELIHGYYACVSYMDAQVGKLLDTMEELDLMDNTVIVFWGDHGWHLGDHDLWTKRTNFEEATKAPLLISSPEIKANKTKCVVEFVDIYPTLCELAGISTPEKLDGVSLVPLMKDKNCAVKKYAVSQFPRWIPKEEFKASGFKDKQMMGYTIRTERYRYTMWMADFKTYDKYSDKNVYAEELYDYQDDPLESRNLANDAKYAEAKKEMKANMLEYFEDQYKKGRY